VVVPTCDLTVHHGGATTAMTIMTAGVPQLITPPNTHTRAIADALAGFGAAQTIRPLPQEADHELADVLAAGSREILADPRYAERAQALAAEMAELPTPADVVRTMETLTVN
jgi:UDP:flavonoid glycosyltransferase YjiC (YdhE family)